MAVLAILQPDPRAEARLSGALTGAHDVVLQSSWEALEETLDVRAFDACLVDVEHPNPDRASQRIAKLRHRFPNLAIVACVDPQRVDGFFGLGGLGVDGVVFAASLPTKVRSDFDTALSLSRARQVARALERALPEPGPEAVAWAMEHAGANTSVAQLAKALGHTPRTLRDQLGELALPSPVRLLLWGRLLLAGARLGDDGRKVEDVAFSLGYATSTSFARAMKLHTGLTPAEVSRRGGMDAVMDALLERAFRSADATDAPLTNEDGSPVPGTATGAKHDPVPDRAAESTDDTPARHTSGSAGSGSRMSRVASVAGAVLMAGCASLGLGGPSVERSEIERVLDTPPIDQLHVGVLAVDASTGRTLYAHNEHRKFIPASNQKILVTATALSLLGPEYRFKTEVWTTGRRVGDRLHGDIVVVGSGDPSLSDRYWPSGTAALQAIADSIVGEGITLVDGALVVDVAAWDSTSVGPTWEVEDLRYRYGSTGGAFAVAEGEIDIVVEAGTHVGAAPAVSWSPRGTEDFLVSDVVTVPPDSTTRMRPSYLPESRRLVLEGTIAQGSIDTLTYAVRDPVRQSAAALARALTDAGVRTGEGWRVRWAPGDRIAASPEERIAARAILVSDGEEAVHEDDMATGGKKVNGGDASTTVAALDPDDEPVGPQPGDGSGNPIRDNETKVSLPACPSDHVADCDGARRIAVLESPPLSELVGGILEPSQNWITEQLVRAVGARFGSEGSWREGIGVVEAYLINEVGVDPLDIAARDGSGLSFYNLVTPRALVRILLDMDAGPFAAEYRSAMAEPGEEDSTLETRLPELEGRLFAKTGTISNVNSLSGYLVRRDGREVVFSILSNGSGLPASQVRRAIDQIVRALAG